MKPEEALANLIRAATDNGTYSEPAGTDDLREALQALADVRTLDDWERDSGREVVIEPVGDRTGVSVFDAHGLQYFERNTPDAARHAAAEWVRRQPR